MGAFSAGQVVFLPFPFSDLTRDKLRPVLLLADAGRGDWIVCQITSNPYSDQHAIQVDQDSFSLGGLLRTSYVRPNKLFTAHESLMAASKGTLHKNMLDRIRQAVTAMILESVT